MSRDELQGRWILVCYRKDEEMVEPSQGSREPAHLHIGADRVAGTMGVNRVVGRLGDDGLPGLLATTMMAGPAELMEQEADLLRLLEEADAVEVDASGMTWSRDGLKLVEFQRSGTNDIDRSSQ